MKTFTLNPINGRKSFGSKMYVTEEVVTEYNNIKTVSKLYSYNTLVAEYDHEINQMTINGKYSVTTNTHINAFLNYYGFDTCTAKEMEKYFV